LDVDYFDKKNLNEFLKDCKGLYDNILMKEIAYN